MKWFLLALVLALGALGCGPLRAGALRYWDADYDSLARALPRQAADTARLRTLVHLLALHPTSAAALPQLDQLLALNQRLRTLDEAPYRALRAGVARWQQGGHDAEALDSLQAAVAAFDRAGRPIPWLLIDLVIVYNRLNRMAARKQYYEAKLTDYRLSGAVENTTACYISQGGYYRRMGDYNRTLNCLLRGADLARTFSRKLYVNELIVSGDVYADWGNRDKAVQYLRRAQGLFEFKRLPGLSRVFTYLTLSRLHAEEGRGPAALRAADAALTARVADPYEQQMGRAYGLVQKAAVLVQLRRLELAEPLLRRAQQLDDSLDLPMSGKPGEFELDATWARYYLAHGADARAETHLLQAYRKASTARLDKLRPKYLAQLAAFYDGRGRPAEAQRYSRAYIALTDTFDLAQNTFHVAQYESERVEQAQGAQIADLRQAQAVQAVRLRFSKGLLLGALAVVVVLSGLGAFIYRQLRVNRGTLAQLRRAQGQLVQAEKMAFLGELTAGIAHELQNPLNFMKNFAEVSTDLVADMHGARSGAGLEQEILVGLKQNLQQISQHGQRASSIIKDMLAHSRTGAAPRQPIDLNHLAADSLRLAYEGLRTTDSAFEAVLNQELDPGVGLVALVTQDMGRVLLNLCANALYAVRERQRLVAAGPDDSAPDAPYLPTVTVSTRRPADRSVEIRVRDNGPGMAKAVRARIFEPFFTTKPAGEGTGLGLSMSYDIVTKGHGGTLLVESREGEGTEFVITLPG